MYSISVTSNFSAIPELASVPPISALIVSQYPMLSGTYPDHSVWVAPVFADANFSATVSAYTPEYTQVMWSEFPSNPNYPLVPYYINGAACNPAGNLRGTHYDQRATSRGFPMDWYNSHQPPYEVSADYCYIIASSSDLWVSGNHPWNAGYWTNTQSNVRSAIAAKFPIVFLSAVPSVPTFRPGPLGKVEDRRYFPLSDFDATRIPQIFDEDTGTFSGYYYSNVPSPSIPSPAVSPSWIDLYLATLYYVGDDLSRWGTEAQCPGYHGPGYGQQWSELLGTILLKSLFKYDYEAEGHDADYRTLTLRNVTQWGIDLWSAFLDERQFEPLGGHMQGRKSAIIAAGILLDDPILKNPDAYLGDHTFTAPYRPGLGKFQENHVFWSGIDEGYNVTPSAWFNGFYWGHEYSIARNHPSATNAFLKNDSSLWNYTEAFGTKYSFGENCESQFGIALFMLAMGYTKNWSQPIMGATTQGTFGITKPFWEKMFGTMAGTILDPNYLTNLPEHFVSSFHTSAVILESHSLSGTQSSKNYTAYYFRKYRFSDEIHNNLSNHGKITYPLKYIDIRDFSGPYLTTNEEIIWGENRQLVWELFQCPSGATALLHRGKILDTPIDVGNGYKLYIDLENTAATSVPISTPNKYGVTLYKDTLGDEPPGGLYDRFGYQAAFSLGDGTYMTTNAVEIGLYNDNPGPEETGGITLTDSQLAGISNNKIGIPTVKSYGSSYGKYSGSKLEDYKSPKDNYLNNKDYKDVVEFKDFNRTVKDYVLTRLGYPVVDVELDDYQIELCIDEAISKLEYHAPDWMTQYAVFETSGGIGVYDIPKPIIDNLNDVWYRRDFFKFGASPGSLEYDFAVMFFTNNGLFNNYNVSQYLLMQQYLKQIKNVLGQMSSWQVINNKYLHIWPVPENNTESVILEFRAFDPETIHHAYKSWVQRFALALSKEILGGIRSKYQTLPGPGGGTRLNGSELIAQAREDKKLLIEELTSSIESPPIFDIF